MAIIRTLAVAALAALGAASALAQTYPSKPIRIIVSTSPGGITDILARLLGNYITVKTGQPHVIDNRAGASGNIAMDAVAKAAPDGYTLGFANTGNITVNPYLFKYDDVRPAERSHSGRRGRHRAAVPDHEPEGARQQSQGVHRLRQGQPRQGELRGGRRRHHARPDRRRVRAPRGPRQARVRAVPRHRAGGDRRLQGEVQITFVSMGPHLEFVQQRQAQGARRRDAEAHALRAGRADLRRGRLPRVRNVDLVLAVRAQGHADADRRAAQRLYPRACTTTPKPRSGSTPSSSIH